MLSHTSRISLALRRIQSDPRSALKLLGQQSIHGAKATGRFLKSCYVDGFRALIEGRYNRRQAAMIIAGTLPTILGTLMITVPAILFPSPEHREFFHFARTLSCDSESLIPVALGALTSTLGLKIPIA